MDRQGSTHAVCFLADWKSLEQIKAFQQLKHLCIHTQTHTHTHAHRATCSQSSPSVKGVIHYWKGLHLLARWSRLCVCSSHVPVRVIDTPTYDYTSLCAVSTLIFFSSCAFMYVLKKLNPPTKNVTLSCLNVNVEGKLITKLYLTFLGIWQVVKHETVLPGHLC